MQGYFDKKEWQKGEQKRLRLNTERGINLHRHTEFRYNKGAIRLSNDQVKAYSSDMGIPKKEFLVSDRSRGIKKLTHEDIKRERVKNEEFHTSKKHLQRRKAAKRYKKK